MNRIYLCIAVLLGCTTLAHGELLEMRYFAFASGAPVGQLLTDQPPFDLNSGTTQAMVEFLIVWDTEAAPTVVNGNIIGFPIMDYSITIHDLRPNPLDAIVLTPETGGAGDWIFNPTSGPNATGELYFGRFFADPTLGFVQIEINLFYLEGNFSLGMNTMPNAPGDYAVNLGNVSGLLESSMSCVSPTSGFGFTAQNTGGLGGASGSAFVGSYGSAIRYTVTTYTPPPPAPCSPADLNSDGVLNFFDVSVFLGIFSAGCP